MNTRSAKNEGVERGSAMVISVLVTAIMSLLGISYLLMADTENKIAENERLSSQCLYFGEGVVREVKRWFDRPPYVDLVNGQRNLVQPTTTIVDLDGGDPANAVDADGSALLPFYKVGVDLDADGHDDIFDKPYRPARADTLLGIEDHPDMMIDRGKSSATATFLDSLRDKIAPSFPASSAGLTARINQIQIYEPPYLDIGGTWTRYGMATVKATVEIVKTVAGGGTTVVASRVVKAVLNETPYPGPFGPLQSCQDLNWNGSFRVHWGPVTSVGNADPKGNTLPTSIPRDVPPSAKLDMLHGWNSPADDAVWAALKAGMQGKKMDDPWWRLLIGGVDHDYPAVMTQQIITPPSPDSPDHSNMFHRMDPVVGCPEFDYQTWKDISKSGGSDVHYYTWGSGDAFLENGNGAQTTFRALTDNRQGLHFFDTMDGQPPNPGGTNLTPAIAIQGGTYGAEGFIYVNTSNYSSQGLTGRAIDMVWPGEPIRDSNQNGVLDGGEDWLNLDYNSASTTDPTDQLKADSADTFGGSVTWNKYGPHITGQTAVMWGVLYVSGQLDSSGNAWYYGSVITKGGTANTMTGTPDLWWDPRLVDNWPPPGWDLPRVIITRWQTDL
jgi:hypothetical protein